LRRFSQFACIDWSGAQGERQKGMAVAICEAGAESPRLLSRPGGWSREAALGWLIDHAAQASDLLIGIDFSPSLPFADQDAYFPGWADAPVTARELWAFVDRHCAADPHLAASSFVDHATASAHFRRSHGRKGDLFGDRNGRLRVVERRCRDEGLGPAQSCFNLVGAAQVGKSSLTGMRVLHRLGGRVPIWPFDDLPARGPLIVEIYTTIAARAAGVTGGSKMRCAATLGQALGQLGVADPVVLDRYDDHSTDAILTAAWLRAVHAEPRLWFPAPLTPLLAQTEGWTFGVP
jgi:hypothetical protein